MVGIGAKDAMAKEGIEKRYEKHGRIKPCVLNRDDIFALAKRAAWRRGSECWAG
jgi:hypothetical protein